MLKQYWFNRLLYNYYEILGHILIRRILSITSPYCDCTTWVAEDNEITSFKDCKSCLEKALSLSSFAFRKHHSSNISADFLAWMVAGEMILKESSANICWRGFTSTSVAFSSIPKSKDYNINKASIKHACSITFSLKPKSYNSRFCESAILNYDKHECKTEYRISKCNKECTC